MVLEMREINESMTFRVIVLLWVCFLYLFFSLFSTVSLITISFLRIAERAWTLEWNFTIHQLLILDKKVLSLPLGMVLISYIAFSDDKSSAFSFRQTWKKMRKKNLKTISKLNIHTKKRWLNYYPVVFW